MNQKNKNCKSMIFVRRNDILWHLYAPRIGVGERDCPYARGAAGEPVMGAFFPLHGTNGAMM
jgi:hypothetical protein